LFLSQLSQAFKYFNHFVVNWKNFPLATSRTQSCFSFKFWQQATFYSELKWVVNNIYIINHIQDSIYKHLPFPDGSTLYTGSNSGYTLFSNWNLVILIILSNASSICTCFGTCGEVAINRMTRVASHDLNILSLPSSFHSLGSSSQCNYCKFYVQENMWPLHTIWNSLHDITPSGWLLNEGFIHSSWHLKQVLCTLNSRF